MIYVVTGFYRTFTSVMMQALEAGGIPLCVDAGREVAMQRHTGPDGYKANPRGFYEIAPDQYMQTGFTSNIPDGHAVKMMPIALPVLVAKPTTLIWMHRDWSEVLTSFKRSFPNVYRDDHPQFRNWPNFPITLEKHVKDICSDRRSLRIIDIQASELITKPLDVFYELSKHVPIDFSKAAAQVDPTLYRNRNAA